MADRGRKDRASALVEEVATAQLTDGGMQMHVTTAIYIVFLHSKVIRSLSTHYPNQDTTRWNMLLAQAS